MLPHYGLEHASKPLPAGFRPPKPTLNGGKKEKSRCPYDDARVRQACGFRSEPADRVYFLTDKGKASGIFHSSQTSASELIFENSGAADVVCIAEARVKNLTFEESAIVSAEVTVKGLKSSQKPELTTNVIGNFQYDWKTVNTELSIDIQIDQRGAEIGQIAVWTALKGIDFVKLQMTPPGQSRMGFSDLLAAGLSGLQVEFIDRGFVELALREGEKKTGKTPRTARREAYTTLEQYRSLFDPSNQTVISQTCKVLQDTILDGGGFKITIKPHRDIKFIEFLNEQTLINLLSELNMSFERIK